MDENHPAMIAAQNSWRCVQANDKRSTGRPVAPVRLTRLRLSALSASLPLQPTIRDLCFQNGRCSERFQSLHHVEDRSEPLVALEPIDGRREDLVGLQPHEGDDTNEDRAEGHCHHELDKRH